MHPQGRMTEVAAQQLAGPSQATVENGHPETKPGPDVVPGPGSRGTVHFPAAGYALSDQSTA
jgi:hypothetical protein